MTLLATRYPLEQTPEQRAATYAAAGIKDTSNTNVSTAPNATDSAGRPVYIGDPSINQGFNYNPGTPGAPTTPTESPLDKATADYYESLTKAPPDPDAVRETVRKQMQGTIDATNSLYDELVKGQTTVNEGNAARVRGININSGLAGSDFASANAAGQDKVGQEALDAIQKKRAVDLATILGNIDSRATAEVDKETATAKQNSQDYIAYLKDKQDKAKTDLTSTAGMGITYDQLKTENPDVLSKLLTQTGLNEQQARALFIANAPQGTYINADKPEIVNNKAVFFKQTKDPITGQVKITSESLDLPDAANFDPKNVEIVSRTDGIYAINKIPNADGSFSTYKFGQANPVKAPAESKISISEAKASGLPISVVGQSEADIVQSLSSDKMPQWFIDKSKTEGITPTSGLWDTYRKSVNDTFNTDGGGA